jgi:hypothetical protein
MADVLTLTPPPAVPQGHKECPDCRIVKPESHFGRNRGMRDGLQFYCRPCNRIRIAKWRKANPGKAAATQAAYYRAHKKLYAERRNRWRRKRVAQLVAMLKAAPCMDCKQSFPSCVMDFDHRPGEVKRFLLKTSKMVTYKLTTIMLEIAKCDLVCANCHRVRTARRRRGDEGV